ncbi:MAG: hypothetical protein ABIE43_01640 [Patescibacteria group bacterium]
MSKKIKILIWKFFLVLIDFLVKHRAIYQLPIFWKKYEKDYIIDQRCLRELMLFEKKLDKKVIIIDALNAIDVFTKLYARGKTVYFYTDKEMKKIHELPWPTKKLVEFPDCDCPKINFKVSFSRLFFLIEEHTKKYWEIILGTKIDSNGFLFYAFKLRMELREIETEIRTNKIYFFPDREEIRRKVKEGKIMLFHN